MAQQHVGDTPMTNTPMFKNVGDKPMSNTPMVKHVGDKPMTKHLCKCMLHRQPYLPVTAISFPEVSAPRCIFIAIYIELLKNQ